MKLNLMGLLDQTGYGQVAVHLLHALDQRGMEVAVFPENRWSIEVSPRHYEAVKLALLRAGDYDPTAACLRIWQPHEMGPSVGRGKRVAYTTFELDRLTSQEVHHLKTLDLALTASQWGQSVMISSGIPPEMTGVVPHGVDPSVFHPHVQPAIQGVEEDRTVFLACGKWEYRKGHDALARAWLSAFAPNDRVLLVLNCHNPFYKPEENARWESLFQGGAAVWSTPQRLKHQEELAQLMASTDCGVFPSRSEGWNLEALEMLALGKHVIATNYSGHTAFLNDDNARLIQIDRLEPAVGGVEFRGQGNWAHLGESQIQQMTHLLRQVHQQKQEGRLGPNEAGWKTAARHTWAESAEQLIKHL